MQKITIDKIKEGKKGKPRLSAKNGQPGLLFS